MKAKDTPQDNSVTYAGHRKLLYAESDDHSYTTVQSSGWAVEEVATIDAVNAYRRFAETAMNDFLSGRYSPLPYHMYAKRMDPALLASVMGLYQWRLKRHFKPQVFARLSERLLERYADTLGISVSELKHPVINNNKND